MERAIDTDRLYQMSSGDPILACLRSGGPIMVGDAWSQNPASNEYELYCRWCEGGVLHAALFRPITLYELIPTPKNGIKAGDLYRFANYLLIRDDNLMYKCVPLKPFKPQGEE